MSIIEKAVKKAGEQSVKTSSTLKSGQKKDHKRVSKQTLTASKETSNKRAKGSNPIAKIDWKRLAENGYINPEASHSQLAEEYRVIKRPLVVNALSDRPGEDSIENANLILVTSSLPNEGKTFTAVNLALSIAHERDKKVLLIDADVAKPSVAKLLGISPTPGLIDYLENSVTEFSEIVQETDLSGLRVIPAGKQHQFSTELLASNRMIELTGELSKRYPDRIVIFDSPPLLVATQGEVLAGLVGQVILVVEAENTSQTVVMQSVEKLQDCKKVMAVLNKAKTTFELDKYGYGQYAS